jgi:hypothetical protein
MMDAGAFIQSDTKIENMKALSEFKRDDRVYSSASPANQAVEKRIIPDRNLTFADNYSMSGSSTTRAKPGRCFSREKKVKKKQKLRAMSGYSDLLEKIIFISDLPGSYLDLSVMNRKKI